MKRYAYNHIDNETAYEAAIERRIKLNARVGRARRWKAAHADAERLEAWLNESGEFAGQPNDQGVWKSHPAAPRGAFYAKMTESLREWGGLTDGQTAAVRQGLQQALDRAAGRDAAINAQREADLRSAHVGVVGKRGEFTAKVSFRTDYSTRFGTTYVTGLRDADGNVLIVKGSAIVHDDAAGNCTPVERGMTIRFTAFVKGHSEREGVRQTILNRVKVTEVLGG